MRITRERITPEKARQLLALNEKNRTMRPRHVARLTRAIEKGEWNRDNPNPIVVNSKKLLDGQHRLAAIIEADRAVETWVARGARTSVMTTVDTGLARTLGDMLKMQGESYTVGLAGALRQLYLYQTTHTLGKVDNAPGHAEMLRLLEDEPEIREHVAFFYRASVKREVKGLPSPSLCAAVYCILAKVDREDADEFFRKLATGANLELGDPIHALRRALFESRVKPREKTLGAMLIKAWNAWRAGEEVYLLAWRGGGKSPEPFPEIR